jgi:hypothetical protein
MGHMADFAIGPLVAILAPFHNTLVPNETLSALVSFPGAHTFNTTAYSPPYDHTPRNISAWLTANLTIGAESFNETVVGGPSINPSSFNPAVIQWSRKDGSVGFLSLYAITKSLAATVSPGSLDLRYPDINSSSSSFSFLVGTNSWDGKRDVRSWADVEGIKVNISGSVDVSGYEVSFGGMRGGKHDTINDFEYWNFTYVMPGESEEVPWVRLEVEVDGE